MPMTPPATAGAATSEWENIAYPAAAEDTKIWLREQRGLIRTFLDSDYGRTEANRCVAPKRNRKTRDTHFYPIIVRRAASRPATGLRSR